MTRISFRRLATLSFVAAAVVAQAAGGQGYFGRNKVQYETFGWQIIRSEHFDNFFYPAESLLVHDASRQAERWYTRHSDTFRHAFDRKSLVFYADAPDFQQTNVITEMLEEGTGGVTESNHTRVIMPFTGIYANNDHVLGHELVHVFQYNIAEGSGGLQRLGALPLWLIEGMAEYFSLGRNDPLTAMWMRDAVMRDRFPTINQLTTDPKFFPYRYGQALWAYVGGRWGDRAIVDVYRTSLRLGWDAALIRVLGENSDSLSKDWANATKATFLPSAQTRTHPDSVAKILIPIRRSSDYNVSPSLSPDGKQIAFFSTRGLFGIDLYLADAQTGKVLKKLASSSNGKDIDALSFINSAGDFSPDGQHFAYIVYSDGDNEVAIINTKSTDVERKINLGEIGSVSGVRLSPNGKQLLLAGVKGGAGDLYLMELESGKIEQLTNDRFADLQPSWAPDGKSVAFVTDRSGTDFDILKNGDLRLAVMDMATKTIRTLSTYRKGRSINPQFTADGQSILYIADQDGVPDIYRYDLASGQSFRVTKVATGISGITSDSPALTVARASGRVAFTVFKDQGFSIQAFEPDQVVGTLEAGVPAGDVGAELPPVSPQGTVSNSIVTRYLNDPLDGLPSGSDFEIRPYHSQFSLDAIGQPTLGAQFGGPFGGVYGGVMAQWGDQLGDRMIIGGISANGSVKDLGGSFEYINLRKRWNWGVLAAHQPYIGAMAFLGDTAINGSLTPNATNVYYIMQRVYYDEASLFTQYPFSTTRRLELQLSGSHQYYQQEIVEYTIQNNQIVDQQNSTGTPWPSVTYAQPTIALVGDNSFTAYTSPVAGERFRFSYAPVIGTFSFQQVALDYRKYFFMKPFSLAVRGMHLARYGRDAESNQIWPYFLGDESYVRGYGYGSITGNQTECLADNSQGNTNCPVLDRLFGSRMFVANTEFRIPLFGSSEFGLINMPLFPLEVSPFFDAGIAYMGNNGPDFRLASNGQSTACSSAAPTTGPATILTPQSAFLKCTDRIPVFSTGMSFRVNVLGYMVFEAYLAHPFQRPTQNWVWGFQLLPGW